jgi:hypothetical protein
MDALIGIQSLGFTHPCIITTFANDDGVKELECLGGREKRREREREGEREVDRGRLGERGRQGKIGRE